MNASSAPVVPAHIETFAKEAIKNNQKSFLVGKVLYRIATTIPTKYYVIFKLENFFIFY